MKLNEAYGATRNALPAPAPMHLPMFGAIGLAVLAWASFQVRPCLLAIQVQFGEPNISERENELHDTLDQGFHGVMLRLQVATQLIPEREMARPAMESSRHSSAAGRRGKVQEGGTSSCRPTRSRPVAQNSLGSLQGSPT